MHTEIFLRVAAPAQIFIKNIFLSLTDDAWQKTPITKKQIKSFAFSKNL